MKKFVPVILAMTFVGGMLSGCSDYYILPQSECIVGLSKDFKLYFVGDGIGKLCSPIEQDIKGIEKDPDTNYYSVVKGADYNIIVDDFVIDSEGLGGDGYIVPEWWQGRIITGFEKTYKNKQAEQFYTTNYSQVNGDVSVTFTENCTVEATYDYYCYVGGVFEAVKKGSNILDNKIDEFLTEYGILGDRNGFYYLMLKDNICVHQDAWKTNLEVTDYKYEYIENTSTPYAIRAQFTAIAPIVASDEERCLYIACKTHGGKYFTYPTVLIGADGFGMPIRENELKLTFVRQ